jgi:predicted RNase H-like HicB family nuclease
MTKITHRAKGIARFFEDTLGAKLKNHHWSWGAKDPISNNLFLMVWESQIKTDSDGEKVQVDSRLSPAPFAAITLEYLLRLEYKIYMTLKAIVHKAEEGGFWAEVPSLPGCVTQGETLNELKANLREAVELWLSVDDEAAESNASDEVLELTV